MNTFTRNTMIVLALQASSIAIADPASDPGARIAQQGTPKGVAPCMACHGPDGAGMAATGYPRLAGLDAKYMVKQLEDFKAGKRSNPVMMPMAKNLSAKEVTAVAAYYAAMQGNAPVEAKNTLTPIPEDVSIAADEVFTGAVLQQGAPPSAREAGAAGFFQPPAREELPEGPFGEVIRQGQAIFGNTNAHPISSKYVGNDQTCANCHIDTGRLAISAPLWAAWVSYPAYRAKNKKVNTFIGRIQGCFQYSMNAQASAAGAPPAADSDTMVSLVSYSYWLATGAPTGNETMPGRGYSRLAETERGFDPKRGAVVYAAKCALCHGENGAGVAHADGRTIFPALWGAESYNWGAGMHNVDTAAAFIKHNMPLGLSDTLSDQDAWDVAAYVNSHERPQDPRYEGDIATTADLFHGSKFDYYGKRKAEDGQLLGERPASK